LFLEALFAHPPSGLHCLSPLHQSMLARFLRSLGVTPPAMPQSSVSAPEPLSTPRPRGGRKRPLQPQPPSSSDGEAPPTPAPRPAAPPRRTRSAAARALRPPTSLLDLPRSVLQVEVLAHLDVRALSALRGACRELRVAVVRWVLFIFFRPGRMGPGRGDRCVGGCRGFLAPGVRESMLRLCFLCSLWFGVCGRPTPVMKPSRSGFQAWEAEKRRHGEKPHGDARRDRATLDPPHPVAPVSILDPSPPPREARAPLACARHPGREREGGLCQRARSTPPHPTFSSLPFSGRL